MATHSTQASLFSAWLRDQMNQRNLTNRGLGRLIDPENVDRGRRKVLRHLEGKRFPIAKSRAVYIKVFDLDGDPFSDATDVDQPLSAELHTILRDYRVLGQRLTRALERSEVLP